ncbi:heat shock 22 kDa protein, mitochondrial-like [Cornus florida]|uniref:heat shock 22 kDa protein, mitochondrial-like n=1 Tax=Cornus florida TaxID=4283 RepID=UPI0028A0796C|nr:heat shock 22 kDa protein, mitochondrial-like [Cornus florida]XP_059642934.1 heat shock 22 kDa protein, mitochondrial-like [Cornus florida]XP_059642935.1 heat shock 22 kDa protein, mitochondrial-like [Cornus florida]XP_059642936.1 heat shock 22 kDa protein, mitochondrial-like [Cornus florida]XP_059642937.1 heat shock 22 kDa protein, mitochondrial-like [Cornus florida]
MASRFLTVAKLFRSNRSFTVAASPFAGHHHSFSSSGDSDYHTRSQPSRGSALKMTMIARMKHPFLNKGMDSMCQATEYERESIVKIDMPGIAKEGLDIKVKKLAIHIEGKTQKEDEDEDDDEMGVRGYSGVIDLPRGIYNTDEIKATIKLGILKMVIPKMDDVSTLSAPSISFRGAPATYSTTTDERRVKDVFNI